jgi:hypothetical protein
MKRNILEAARIIRSKNSGPFELTLDVMFKDRRLFELFRDRGIIDAPTVARLYGVAEGEVLGVVWFEPSNAVKATIRRRVPSGAPGDTDIYGAQQHAPLLGLEYEDG